MSGSTLLIQIILLIGVAVVSALLTRSTAGARHQAIRRLFLGMFIVAAVASIVFPQWLSRVANLVGVGRGTDLLLYALVIAFLSYISTSHRRMNRMSRQITRLTRELTLAEARGVRLGTAAATGDSRGTTSGITRDDGTGSDRRDDSGREAASTG